MGTSLCVSLGWQECAFGMAESKKLTGKLLHCHFLCVLSWGSCGLMMILYNKMCQINSTILYPR